MYDDGIVRLHARHVERNTSMCASVSTSATSEMSLNLVFLSLPAIHLSFSLFSVDMCVSSGGVDTHKNVAALHLSHSLSEVSKNY